MADIHGIPDPSMMVPEQTFHSVEVPDLSGEAAQAMSDSRTRQSDAQDLLDGDGDVPSITSGTTAGWPADVYGG